MLLFFRVLQVVGNVNIDTLARRPVDDSFVLRNIASDGQGAKHIYKLNAKSEKDAVFVQRKQDEGGKPVYEKVWRKRCNRCDLFGELHSLEVSDEQQTNAVPCQSRTRRQIRETSG